MIDVTCAVIFFGDKILVVQRSLSMKHPLKWEFPGGKLEFNESEVDCIKREIKEEINIEIEVVKKLTTNQHDYGTVQINLIPFIATYLSGKITLLEHSQFRLLEIRELTLIDWAKADIPIVDELIATYT